MPQIEPKNITAQLDYRGRGNPPSTHPRSSIANCFPGLEFDFRNVWKKLFVGIELHESDNFVVSVEAGSEAAQQGIAFRDALVSVDGLPAEANVTGPRQVGEPDVVLGNGNLEWANSVAEIVSKAGQKIPCRFRGASGEFEVMLEIRNLFTGITIAQEAAEAGDLTQGLCSPWQADYLECGCYYWAASRPDFVNVEVDPQNRASGHNWLRKDRQPTTPKQYTLNNLLSYDDLYRNWEMELRFIIDGKDES